MGSHGGFETASRDSTDKAVFPRPGSSDTSRQGAFCLGTAWGISHRAERTKREESHPKAAR